MTDKQIIIEDCPYFIGGNCQEYLDGVCENHKCDLKIIRELEQKLKRKEQECEELKENLPNAITRLMGELDQLKAENDKYSLFIEKLCDYAGLECDDEEQAMRTLSDLASQMNKARWIIDRYKQYLTEIKEIAIHCIKQDICTTCDYSDKCHIEDEEIPTYDVCKLILQKISEVENEQN